MCGQPFTFLIRLLAALHCQCDASINRLLLTRPAPSCH